MTKRLHDPELGELVDISEAERLTGFTRSTLRSWRLPENEHRAKFPCYLAPANKAWYRLADLELYARTQGIELGNASVFTKTGAKAPDAVEAPLGNVITEAERGAMMHVGKITTENYYNGWFSDLQKAYGGALPFTKRLKVLQVHFHSVRSGIPETEIEYLLRFKHLQSDPTTRFENNEQFWIGTVAALRRILCELKGYDLTDEQILSVPFGDIPPLTEHSKTN